MWCLYITLITKCISFLESNCDDINELIEMVTLYNKYRINIAFLCQKYFRNTFIPYLGMFILCFIYLF